MKNLTVVALIALLVPACASVSVTEPVSVTVDLGTYSVPAAPVSGVALQLPPQTFTTDIDVSDAINKVSSVADNVTVDVSTLTLHSPTDLSWLRSASASVGSQPFAHLDTSSVTKDSATFVIDMSPAEVLRALSAPTTLSFTVGGEVTTSSSAQVVEVDDTLGLVVSGHATKGI